MAIDFVDGIKDVIEQDFDAIGCDGTILNTGHKAGVIRLYEEHLQHALQWLICLLHFTELGTAIKSSMSLPVLKFRRIQCTLPNLKHQMPDG